MKKFTPSRLNPASGTPVSRAMNSSRRLKATLLALFALALVPAAAAAAPKFDEEFPVPGIETNDKIVEGQDGDVWVAVSGEKAGSNDVARITPAGEVKEFPLSAGGVEFAGASGIARDAEGHLWVTGEGKVAKFRPVGGQVSETAIEDLAQVRGAANGGAPIVLGPDGRMWIATAEDVVAFKPTETDLENHRELIALAGLNPHDIDVAGQLLAIADQTRIVTLKTDGTLAKEYPLGGFSQGVAGTPEGLFAYSEPGNAEHQQVGLISPPNALAPIVTPEGKGDPFGVTVGADGAFWFVLGATGFGELARLAPAGTTLERFPGMLKDGLERQIAAGPGNTLWVTVSKAESEGVARYSGVEAPRVPTPHPPMAHDPQTQLGKHPKATVRIHGARAAVRFTFSSPTLGAGFECGLLRLGKPVKDFPFAPCRSPRSYRVGPGRYRFEVRAVIGNLVDSSAATATFRVIRTRPHRHR